MQIFILFRLYIIFWENQMYLIYPIVRIILVIIMHLSSKMMSMLGGFHFVNGNVGTYFQS